jgi:hypothetical protein
MQLGNFILLSKDEKRIILLREGILVAKRSNFNGIVFLFRLHLFYVETYCMPGTEEVLEYRAFEGSSDLYPYVETVSSD